MRSVPVVPIRGEGASAQQRVHTGGSHSVIQTGGTLCKNAPPNPHTQTSTPHLIVQVGRCAQQD